MLTADLTGPYLHSFTGYVPQPRYGAGGTPWTTVTVEEAASKDGPWVQYAHGALDPADPDPTQPLSRSFSAPGATLATGWNRVTFLDGDGNREPFQPVYVGAPWAPTLQDVADLSRAYTRHRIDDAGEQSGAPQPVFDALTDPTAEIVQGYISAAVTEVRGRVGIDIPERCVGLARQTAAWHASATIEAEKEPEGASETEGAYRWKQASYGACLNELIAQARMGALRLV